MRMSKLPSLCLPGDSTTIRAASRDAKLSGSKKRVQNVKDLIVVINTHRKATNKDRVKTKDREFRLGVVDRGSVSTMSHFAFGVHILHLLFLQHWIARELPQPKWQGGARRVLHVACAWD